ncbi:MAG: c-type cytochrome [Candidatus Acidiferrales bacterium]
MKHSQFRLLLAVSVLALLAAMPAFSARQEGTPAVPSEGCTIPEDAAKVANPVKVSASSVAEGKRLFATQCALCHGKTGDGKGDLVEPMKLNVKDYHDPTALKELTDGALFHVLKKGCGQMPGEEGRLKDTQMWNLVNFIRSLARKEAVAKAEEKPAP